MLNLVSAFGTCVSKGQRAFRMSPLSYNVVYCRASVVGKNLPSDPMGT